MATDSRPAMDEASARMLTSLNRFGGAVAQLGARLDGIEEVVGSNPIGSTKNMGVRPGHGFQHPTPKTERLKS